MEHGVLDRFDEIAERPGVERFRKRDRVGKRGQEHDRNVVVLLELVRRPFGHVLRLSGAVRPNRLRRARDFAQVRSEGIITAKTAQEALALLDIDDLGLDALDRAVLGRIIRDFRGGPVGLETIAAALGGRYGCWLMLVGSPSKSP